MPRSLPLIFVLVLSSTLLPTLGWAEVGQAAQSATLVLGSGSGYAGQTVSVNVTLAPGNVVAGLQWTFTYSTSDFSSVQVAAGQQAAAAGKGVVCSSKVGSVTCVLVGLNSANLASGIVAVANVRLANPTPSSPASRTASLNVTNPVGALANGNPLLVSGVGGTVTILKPSPTAVTPSTASLGAQQSQQFSADGSVLWSLSPAVGTITASGRYTAPSLVSSAQQVTVRATNSTNSSYYATATVHLNPVTVTLTPASVSLSASQSQQFTAAVTDAPNNSVTWSRSPAVGSISASGRYTAPSLISAVQTVTVRATSVFDATKYKTATVQLLPAGFFTDDSFVTQIYRDILNRNPDQAGRSAVLAALSSGALTRAEVTANIITSSEFRNYGGYITRCYLGVMRRSPDFGGWWHWYGRMRGGYTQEMLAAEFAKSEEFVNRYGSLTSLTNEQFVTLLYNNVLGRPPDTSGFAYWLDQLKSGKVTRAGVISRFVASPEYTQKSETRVQAEALHLSLWRRSATSAEITNWQAFLSTNSLPQATEQFLTSPEYLDRFK